MNLKDKIVKLAKLFNIEESELILEEVDFFLKEHRDHGPYNIIIRHDPKGELDGIFLKCTAYDIEWDKMAKCPHNNPDIIAELRDSIIYQKKRTFEIDLQKELREGKIGYRGHWSSILS